MSQTGAAASQLFSCANFRERHGVQSKTSPVEMLAQPKPTIVSSTPHVPSGVQHPGSVNKPATIELGQAEFSVPGAFRGKQSVIPRVGAVKPHVLLVVQQLVA